MTGMVKNADCACSSGKSGYGKLVMALLLNLTDYGLEGLQNIRDEKACTSKTRQWESLVAKIYQNNPANI